MTDYGAIAARAAATIARFGAPATLVRVSRLPYDPASSSADAAAEQRFPSVAVRTEYSLRERETGLIDERDSKILLAAVQAGRAVPQPEPRDGLEFAGVRHEVVSSGAIAPAGVPVAYEVQARRP